MKLRPAEPRDEPKIFALLFQHLRSSMFPLSNLEAYGLNGTADRALRVWCDDKVSKIVAITRAGMLMPQMPDATPEDWAAAAEVLRAYAVTGAAGEAQQIRRLLAALGLDNAPTRLDEDELGFELALADLVLPEGPDGELRAPSEDDVGQLVAWRAAYHHEVLGTPKRETETAAMRDIESYLMKDSHRVFWHDGRPVAMTGFNARVAHAVQIGGVYTPPELRGRGYARQAVARHLAEARAQGIMRSVLFTASDTAARVYRAIGYSPAGRFSLILFDGPQRDRG